MRQFGETAESSTLAANLQLRFVTNAILNCKYRLSSTRRVVFSSRVEPIRSQTPVGQAVPFSFFRSAAAGIFSVLFPSECRICGALLDTFSRLPVCSECLTSLQPIDGDLCSICGERVHGTTDIDEKLICGMCDRARPQFVRATAFGSYDAELRELLHLLKYEAVTPASETLGLLLAEAVKKLEVAGAVTVVPVPLHREKQRQRGFNQTELIARAAVKHLGPQFTLRKKVLRRTRATNSQIGLTNHQRRANLRGAFKISAAGAKHIKDCEVLLVDDVLTTGTTVSECTRVLLRAGAKRVHVATVARVLKGEPARLDWREERVSAAAHV